MLFNANAPLRRRLRDARRRLSSPDAVWQRALSSETDFWASYLESGGLEHPDEFRQRLDPAAPVSDALLLEAIKQAGGQHVRIIDVGAGPLTAVGFVDPADPGRQITVTAVDPLADHYRALLERFDLKPPVETVACRGEDVAERFGANSFDVGYSRNALDHAADPMQAIESLVRVVRPGGAIVLTHNRREGEAQHYEQLHQWNFDVKDGRFVVYNRTTFHDIGERLGPHVAITARVFETTHGAWVAATLLLQGDDSG